eukprot:m.385396 g.385396  ORF g.385396 m.385396 type:complete len:179 (-) comp21008_c0_seq1:110-646(-)
MFVQRRVPMDFGKVRCSLCSYIACHIPSIAPCAALRHSDSASNQSRQSIRRSQPSITSGSRKVVFTSVGDDIPDSTTDGVSHRGSSGDGYLHLCGTPDESNGRLSVPSTCKSPLSPTKPDFLKLLGGTLKEEEEKMMTCSQCGDEAPPANGSVDDEDGKWYCNVCWRVLDESQTAQFV